MDLSKLGFDKSLSLSLEHDVTNISVANIANNKENCLFIVLVGIYMPSPIGSNFISYTIQLLVSQH